MNEILPPTADTTFMRAAIDQALQAQSRDEVPIGAVVVCDGRIIARTHNLVQTLTDPTAHAEMQAITSACNAMGGKYLDKCTLYVTVEPCPMCAAAMRWAQLGRLVYATSDDKLGYTTVSHALLHPKTQVDKGLLNEECSEMMRTFFAKKRL